ncbi:MAG: hypothetical protein HY841_12910 [Bacteroidetes bacterium]|nr:hypothetical protein [Bacteroidota bacterium]
MKTLKRIFITLLVLFFLIVGTLLVITFAYENEVKDYMIQQLNKNLKTKVMVDPKDIKLSLLKNFPYASLDFKNVTMLESPIGKSTSGKSGKQSFMKIDTLFIAGDVSLRFNVWDIITKKYNVKKVSAENGKIKLRKGIDGSVNWDIWKGSADTTSSSTDESVFNLEKFQIDNIVFTYRDYKNNSDISCVIHSGIAGGEFTSKNYDLSIKGDLLVNHFNLDSVNYLADKPVKMDLNLSVDNEKNSYQFSDALVYVSDLKISVEGKYTDSNPSYVDVFLKGKDMDVQSVLSLLPEKYHKHISDYDSDGEFYCNAHINGKWDESISPEIKADFGITQAEITQLSSGIVLKEVHMLGNYYASSAKDFLELKTFSASLVNGTLSGNFRMDNFASPFVSTMIKANLPLEDVRHLLKTDTLWNYPIESLSGIMKINMEYKGTLSNSGKYKKSDFEKMNLAGDMMLEDAGMKIKNSTLAFDSINGSFVLNDNDIEVNSFSGKTPKSDFYLKGFLKNILAYTLVDDADINVDADFQSGNLDLNEFLVNQSATTKRDTVYRIHFSPNVNFNLNSNIGHLSFRKFEAENIRGTFQLRNQKLIADPISFSTMDGTITASGMLDGRMDSTILATCDANLNNLNISKLFYQFEDFNQSTMTHQNLRGVGTASVQFASVMNPDLTIDLNRIYVRSNMTIERGELINFEPMKALSKYISVNELEDIKFSTLQNQIEIKDQKIFIPKMDIHSNALDVTMFGSHTFNNEIDYHFKVLMSDVLFNKAKKAKKENDEFGVVEDDKEEKTSLFLSMTGTVDNPVIKYDKQGAKQNLKENIIEEKHSLKQILREEFGLFKKDTTLNKKDKPKDDGKFIIKWDEDEKEKDKKEDDDF